MNLRPDIEQTLCQIKKGTWKLIIGTFNYYLILSNSYYLIKEKVNYFQQFNPKYWIIKQNIESMISFWM